MILNSPLSAADNTAAPRPVLDKVPTDKAVTLRAGSGTNPQATNILGAAEYQARRTAAVTAETSVAISKDQADGRYSGLIVWGMCFVSFLGLQLNQRFGMPAIAIFLAPWMLLIGLRIQQLIPAIAKDWLMLVTVVFAMFSTVWSADPNFTMRASVQYGVTIIIGIAAGNMVSRRVILTSLMMALAVVTFGGILYAYKNGGFASVHGTAGLYGAKNQFASTSAVQFIGAAYLLAFAHKSRFDKLLGLGLAGMALIGVYLGHSAGTLVALTASLGFTFALGMIRKIGGGSVVLMMGGAMVFLAMLVALGPGVVMSGALRVLGKDSTLTGRTDLWSEAFKLIQTHPLLGNGYQALWRLGNPIAEKFWAMFGVARGAGFNFHNEYINTTVDLGLFGAIILAVVLICTATASVRRRLMQKETLNDAIHAIFMYYLFLTLVEAGMFYQFYIAPIIVCLAWSGRLLPDKTTTSHYQENTLTHKSGSRA